MSLVVFYFGMDGCLYDVVLMIAYFVCRLRAEVMLEIGSHSLCADMLMMFVDAFGSTCIAMAYDL